jgi:sulfur relay (sulfurtransferase) DsrF/TusC family protein
MPGKKNLSMALIVRGRPYEHRSARADIDLALAALAMDFDLEVYFQGGAILQLASERNSLKARLPGGYRAWSALQDLGEVRIFAEQAWLDRCKDNGIDLITPVNALSAAELRRGWRRCRHVMVV